MAEWKFPPHPTHSETMSRIEELRNVDEPTIKRQHIVSQVLLRRFSAPSPKGSRLVSHHLRHGPQPPKSIRECGKAPGFLSAAVQSAELLWKEVEDKLGPAIEAARHGGVHGNVAHVATIKDAIALHAIRSYRYMDAHKNAFVEAELDVRQELLSNRRELLRAAFRRKYGLEPGGREALLLMAEPTFEEWRHLESSGIYGRVSIEAMFDRVRRAFQLIPLEIGHTSAPDSLLVSDSPAVSIRFEGAKAQFRVGVAFGDAHTVVLPLSPDCVAALGAEDLESILSSAHVRLLNDAQLLAARDYVYYRPGSNLSRYVEESPIVAKRRRHAGTSSESRE
jgi:hypothetical protein